VPIQRKPVRSCRRQLTPRFGEAVAGAVLAEGVLLGGKRRSQEQREEYAHKDGLKSADELHDWMICSICARELFLWYLKFSNVRGF